MTILAQGETAAQAVAACVAAHGVEATLAGLCCHLFTSSLPGSAFGPRLGESLDRFRILAREVDREQSNLRIINNKLRS